MRPSAFDPYGKREKSYKIPYYIIGQYWGSVKGAHGRVTIMMKLVSKTGRLKPRQQPSKVGLRRLQILVPEGGTLLFCCRQFIGEGFSTNLSHNLGAHPGRTGASEAAPECAIPFIGVSLHGQRRGDAGPGFLGFQTWPMYCNLTCQPPNPHQLWLSSPYRPPPPRRPFSRELLLARPRPARLAER